MEVERKGGVGREGWMEQGVCHWRDIANGYQISCDALRWVLCLTGPCPLNSSLVQVHSMLIISTPWRAQQAYGLSEREAPSNP